MHARPATRHSGPGTGGHADSGLGGNRHPQQRRRYGYSRPHPAIVWLGPVYGVLERTAAGWRMDHRSCSTPREARDSLGCLSSALVPVLDSPLKGQRQGEVCRRQTEWKIEFRRQAGHLRARQDHHRDLIERYRFLSPGGQVYLIDGLCRRENQERARDRTG